MEARKWQKFVSLDKQTSRQADKQTSRQADKQADKRQGRVDVRKEAVRKQRKDKATSKRTGSFGGSQCGSVGSTTVRSCKTKVSVVGSSQGGARCKLTRYGTVNTSNTSGQTLFTNRRSNAEVEKK